MKRISREGFRQRRLRRQQRQDTRVFSVRVTVERLQDDVIVLSKITGTGEDVVEALFHARSKSKNLFRAIGDALVALEPEEEEAGD